MAKTKDRSEKPAMLSLRKRILGSLVVLLLLLFALELVGRAGVWFWDVPTSFQPQPFRQDGITDPVLWWTLRPNVNADVDGYHVRINAFGFRDLRDSIPSRGTLIFSLGDSTTYGWHVQPGQIYTAIAESQLSEDTDREIHVISAGVPGYTSYQCLRLFEQKISQHRPDWITILASNNECRPRPIGDRQRGERLQQKYRLRRLLGFSHFCVLIGRWPEALGSSWERRPGRHANTEQEYRANLTELIQQARSREIRVLLMTVPLRLDYEPDWPVYDRLGVQALALLDEAAAADLPDEAYQALLHRAAAVQPDQFAAHWQLAQLYKEQNKPNLAIQELALARQHDMHPETIKPSYNQVVREVADSQGAILVDLDKRFRESGLPESELFQDHCHPSVTGHRLIALAMADALNEALVSQAAPQPGSVNHEPGD